MSYCPSLRQWGVARIGGEVPRPLAGAVGVPLRGGLYVWGGLEQGEGGSYYTYSTSRSLLFLDLEARLWSRLEPAGDPPPPSEKGVGWTWGGAVFLFSGYSATNCRDQARAQGFDWEEEGEGGWHNALVCYSPGTGAWSWPRVQGATPCPRAGAGAVVVDNKVFLFGGRTRRGRLNDLQCLHLDTWTWRQVESTTWPDPWDTPSTSQPAPRALHSMVRVPGTPRIAVYGGLGLLHAPLQDLWWLHGDTELWEEVELKYDHGEVRCWQVRCGEVWCGVVVVSCGVVW